MANFGYQIPSWMAPSSPGFSPMPGSQPNLWSIGGYGGGGEGQPSGFGPMPQFQAPGAMPMPGGSGLPPSGFNPTFGHINTAIQGIGMLGNLGLGAWALHQSQQAFDFQKGMATKNFLNSVKSYNDALETRIKTRYANDPTRTAESTQAEIDRRKLGT